MPGSQEFSEEPTRGLWEGGRAEFVPGTVSPRRQLNWFLNNVYGLSKRESEAPNNQNSMSKGTEPWKFNEH